MGGNNYTISNGNTLSLSADHADKLLRLGDGNCALLYLYALRKNGSFSSKSAAADLKRTESEIERAAQQLKEQGLLSSGSGRSLPLPAEELPEYSAEDIAESSAERGEFPAIIEEAQRILGKTLTGTDVKTLFGLYDYLKLPAEVIVLLINHCVEFTRERSGPGKLPSMRTIEKEGYIWFNKEIMTLERAEEYLRTRRAVSDATSEIKALLQINGRGLSPTERQYVESWLAMGFGSDAIGVAYDRTVVKTGGLQWKYMNSILTSWNAKNLHSVEEIMSGDHRGAPGQSASPPAADDTERLKKLLGRSADRQA